MSERAGHDIPIEHAVDDYVRWVLPAKPDERSILGVDTVAMPVIAWDDDDPLPHD